MTTMSNLGLERFLTGLGLHLVRTAVGDRYVLEKMRQDGYNLGGEQSGHFITLDTSTTGDGLMAALQVLAALKEAAKPASETLNLFTPAPQILKNVRYDGVNPLETAAVKDYLEAISAQMAGKGRILVRKSGTESLIRVMAEGDNADEVQRVVDDICEQLTRSAA